MTLEQIIQDEETLVVVNHSGGKDSQVMYLFVKNLVPEHRLVVIHAHLPGVEWEGTVDHIEATIEHEFFQVQSRRTFLQMVEERGMWPSPKNRQCTSDLKRGPIAKQIKHICNTRGFNKVLNCMGLRAQESSARARKTPFKQNNRETNSKRTWWEWLPIHDWTEDAVFSFIESHGQKPHWAYGEGMTRLSCCFCIMASKKDLCTAARLNPELFQQYVEIEKRIGHTFKMPTKNGGAKYLDQIVEEAGQAEKLQLNLFH